MDAGIDDERSKLLSFVVIITSPTCVCLHNAHTPFKIIAGIRCILCVACKCVCDYRAHDKLQLGLNDMLRFCHSKAFLPIDSFQCDKKIRALLFLSLVALQSAVVLL